MLAYDVRADLLEAATALTPGIESPTDLAAAPRGLGGRAGDGPARRRAPDHGRAVRPGRPRDPGDRHPRLPAVKAACPPCGRRWALGRRSGGVCVGRRRARPTPSSASGWAARVLAATLNTARGLAHHAGGAAAACRRCAPASASCPPPGCRGGRTWAGSAGRCFVTAAAYAVPVARGGRLHDRAGGRQQPGRAGRRPGGPGPAGSHRADLATAGRGRHGRRGGGARPGRPAARRPGRRAWWRWRVAGGVAVPLQTRARRAGVGGQHDGDRDRWSTSSSTRR